MINNVLFVCKGNGDRSPMMRNVFQMLLDNMVPPYSEVLSESAGILEIADKGGGASPLMIVAAKRIGIDLSLHKRRWINRLNINRYDLIVCVDDNVAAYVIGLGVDIKKVCNVRISNAWPSTFQRDFDDTAGKVLEAMFHVITRYFCAE